MRQGWLARLFGRSDEHALEATDAAPSIDDLKAESTAVEHLGAMDPERLTDEEAPPAGNPP
jgi:hypothetical protein